jgi:hypothetical protein
VSAFGIVFETTRALTDGLQDALFADPLTRPLASQIVTLPPTAGDAGAEGKKISFWPYRITRDEFVSNEPLVPLGPELLGYPPLIVDVWYLLTPITGSGDSDQLVIEKALEYVYDLDGPLVVNGAQTRTRMTFETPGSDELFRLWSAMDTAYALSAVFCARSIAIDSLRPPQRASRVIERYDRYVRMGA